MRYDKRGTVAPERAALDEEAKRLKVAARYLGEEKRRQHRMMRWVCGAWLAFVVCSAGVVGVWLRTTSVELEADTLGARPMPSTPFEAQKKPPCTPRRQVAINGGCWVELATKPLDDQCGDDGYAHGGKCYVPVKQAKRPPTSVMP